jgi:hypothetical protein
MKLDKTAAGLMIMLASLLQGCTQEVSNSIKGRTIANLLTAPAKMRQSSGQEIVNAMKAAAVRKLHECKPQELVTLLPHLFL